MNAKSGWLIAALLPDGRVLAAGGINPASGEMYTTTEIYDPATGEWNLTAPLVPAHCRHAAVVLPDGRVLMTGGAQRCGPEVSPFNIVEAYDYQSGTWGALPPLNIARVIHTATLLPDGRVFVAGGYDGNTFAASTEILELDGR